MLDANWEKDAEAKALHDKLEAVGSMFKILDRESRERDYAAQRLERERNATAQRASA